MVTIHFFTILRTFTYSFFIPYVSSHWFDHSGCSNLYYFNFCSFCYSIDNVMYFLSYVSYYERCEFIRIGNQRDIPKKEISRQEDAFMSRQSEYARKRYEDYKKNQLENEREEKLRLDLRAQRLSQEAKSLYEKVYSILNNTEVTIRQEYQLVHTTINEAKFKAVVEASEFIPAKYFANTFGGLFAFHIHDNPFDCYYC
uniref:V-type proton ATPase subunit G n=1 Tax=Strongyloides venezuelensis TaxID=75913 RepID=A0A0K0FT67_STRVS